MKAQTAEDVLATSLVRWRFGEDIRFLFLVRFVDMMDNHINKPPNRTFLLSKIINL